MSEDHYNGNGHGPDSDDDGPDTLDAVPDFVKAYYETVETVKAVHIELAVHRREVGRMAHLQGELSSALVSMSADMSALLKSVKRIENRQVRIEKSIGEVLKILRGASDISQGDD